MKKTIKKQKKKLQISSLAEDATSKIIKNKIIYTQINNYNKYIEMIKSFITNSSQNNKLTENFTKNNGGIIKNEFQNLLNTLKNNNNCLKLETKKLKQKYDTNKDTYFNLDLSSYKRVTEDSFILSHSLNQKLNIIKKLKESIHSSKDYNIFQEPKRDNFIDIKTGEDIIYYNNEEIQKYALYEFQQFNKYYNRSQRKLNKRNLYKNKIQIFNQIINYFKQCNNINNKNFYQKAHSTTLIFKNGNIKNNYNDNAYLNNAIIKNNKTYIKPIKNYKEEENIQNIPVTINQLNQTEVNPSLNNIKQLSTYGTDQTYSNIMSQNLFPLLYINKEHRNSLKKKKKIIIPKVEELFDLANNEGEKEALIDEELHSDDDTVFMPKIKQNKKIIKDYIIKVKEKIPKISLSLIEYNKIKIINEADLYSYNRRKEQRGNTDENIKIMKNKLKIIKRRCNINKKKYETMQNFVKECENDYNRLKSMKVQMSMKADVNFMKKEFFTKCVKDKIDEEDELNYQKELDEYLNDPELNDPYFTQYQELQTDITHRQIETQNNILKKINNENLENTEDNTKKKYDKIKTKTHREYKKEKIKRANSK